MNARVSSLARDVVDMPSTPHASLVRDQLFRLLSGITKLNAPSTPSVFDRRTSVQSITSQHMICVASLRWGRGPRPLTADRIDNNQWLRRYKEFIWDLYDLDPTSWKIDRNFGDGARDGDPLDLQPGGHHLDDDVHVAFGWRKHDSRKAAAAAAVAAKAGE